MRIDEGRPVDNETPAVKKGRVVEQPPAAEAVQAYGTQPVKDKQQEQRHARHRGGGSRNLNDVADLQGIDIDEVDDPLRQVIIQLLDDLGHLQESLTEARQRIAYLEDRTDHDPTTGCLTRRAFQAALEQVLGLDEQNGIHSTLVLMAVPDWGKLRRRDGLATAEAFAIQVSEALDRHARTGDLVARLDDGVFALVFVASGQDEAQTLISALRQDVASVAVDGRSATIIDCLRPLSGGGAQETLAQADRALVDKWKNA